jgi:hypothetical protein
MKKIVCLFVFVNLFGMAQAQLWLGGQFGYYKGDNFIFEGARDVQSTNIAPRIGYQLRNWVFGMDVGYALQKFKNNNGSFKVNAYSFGVFGRYIRKTSEHFGLWVELNTGILNGRFNSPNNQFIPSFDYNNFNVGLRPGAIFYLNKHLAAEVTIGQLGMLLATSNYESDNKITSFQTSANISDRFSLGVNWIF